MTSKKNLLYYVAPYYSTLLLFLGWLYTLSTKPKLLPTPAATWDRLILLLERPLARAPLWKYVVNNLRRMVIALVVASVAGVIFSIFMGWNRTFSMTLGSLFQIIRPTPPTTWIPLVTIWFGIREFSKVLVIFIGAFSIMVTSTYTGATVVDPLNLAMGKIFHVSKREILTEIVLPAVLPVVFSDIRVATSVGWAIMLAAEMVGAASGVDFLIFCGNELRDVSLVLVCMPIIGIIGTLFSMSASWLERRLCLWKS